MAPSDGHEVGWEGYLTPGLIAADLDPVDRVIEPKDLSLPGS